MFIFVDGTYHYCIDYSPQAFNSILREWRLPSQLSRHTIALDPVFAALFANKVFIGALRRHLPLLLTRLIRRLRCYAAIQSIFRSFLLFSNVALASLLSTFKSSSSSVVYFIVEALAQAMT